VPPARHCLGRALRTCAELPGALRRLEPGPPAAEPSGGGEREREGVDEEETVLPVEKEIRVPEIRKQRRRGKEISQGPMRKYRKLRGPVCKTKFPVDLKPK
jgi:hypothetical protein